MNKLNLIFSLIFLAVGLVVFGVWYAPKIDQLTFTRQLGVPGPHSPSGRLANLPLDLVFDQGRSRILSRQDDGKILAWDLATGQPQQLATTGSLFAYCRPHARLLINDPSGNLLLMDLTTGQRRTIASGTFDHAQWNGDCSRFALAGAEANQVELWDGTSLTRLAAAETTQPVRNGLALSPDGTFIAAAQGSYSDAQGHQTTLEVFHAGDGMALRRTASLREPALVLGMWKMVFGPRSGQLVVGSQIDARAGLRGFAPNSGETLWGHDDFSAYWVRALALSPDGRLVASGDEHGNIRLWDMASGARLYDGNTGLVVQSLAFSDDGKLLAVALWDSTIGILETDQLVK